MSLGMYITIFSSFTFGLIVSLVLIRHSNDGGISSEASLLSSSASVADKRVLKSLGLKMQMHEREGDRLRDELSQYKLRVKKLEVDLSSKSKTSNALLKCEASLTAAVLSQPEAGEDEEEDADDEKGADSGAAVVATRGERTTRTAPDGGLLRAGEGAWKSLSNFGGPEEADEVARTASKWLF